MILERGKLNDLRGKVGLVAGGFDPLHHGHIAYFNAAAEYGLPLVASVNDDKYVSQKHVPLLNHEQRCQLLNSLRSIDYVYPNVGSTAEVLDLLKPKLFFKGREWEGKLPEEEVDFCEQNRIEIVFLDCKIASSTELIENIQQTDDAALKKFECLALSQTMPMATEYSEHYFSGTWRTASNEYTLEKRRQIEGKHPEVIKAVFDPKSAIDFGCGPGFLIQMLDEVGVTAEGIDISEDARRIAPSSVRDRIHIGSIAGNGLADQSYELVICREVLEHLPIISVHEAVQEMCRVSSRFVYLTTRFHSSPVSLLDVTDEMDIDPTHITLLNKNLLRLMFVINGFKRRADLEQKMDWMKKNRVLVYERTPKAFNRS